MYKALGKWYEQVDKIIASAYQIIDFISVKYMIYVEIRTSCYIIVDVQL